MKKSNVFLLMALFFGVLFVLNILFVFDWGDPRWDNNKSAYLTTFSNGLLFVSQLYLYLVIRKKEQHEGI